MRNLKTAALLTGMLGLALLATATRAEGILMARSAVSFDEALPALTRSIEEHGYAVAHIQKCDGGLRGFGYKTDKYRVVFFGKLDEVRELTRLHVELAPFLPLKMAIFAERDETVLSIVNPKALAAFYDEPALQTQFDRWESDIRSVLQEMRSLQPAGATAER
jgi:uncharacterized protein (DUF302 family)